MQSTTVVTRGLSVVLFLLFLSTILTAQVKIKEKVEINSVVVPPTNPMPTTSLTINYNGWVDISNQYGSSNIFGDTVKITWNGGEAVFYKFDPITGAPADYVSGPDFDVSAGTTLTFTVECSGVVYPLNFYEVGSNDCGGFWMLQGGCFVYGLDLQTGRTSPNPPYYIDFYSSIGLVYPYSDFIPI
jgi:hypothetical protein